MPEALDAGNSVPPEVLSAGKSDVPEPLGRGASLLGCVWVGALSEAGGYSYQHES